LIERTRAGRSNSVQLILPTSWQERGTLFFFFERQGYIEMKPRTLKSVRVLS